MPVQGDSWKQLYKELETFKQPSALLKVKELADKYNQPKTVIQMKNKLRKLKDFCNTIDDSSWKTQFFFYTWEYHVQQIFESLRSHFEFLLRDFID